MDAAPLDFPKHRNFHFAFITRDLDAGVRSFEHIYGDQARIFTGQPIQTALGVAYIDYALFDLNGQALEIIQPAGGADSVYRDEMPELVGQTRLHHVASIVDSHADWKKVNDEIARHHLPTPVRGSAEYDGGVSHYVYIDMKRLLGHYLEFVFFEESPA